MKLLNYSTTYFAVPLLFMLTLWAGIFYFAMLDEIYDSIGDVLENQKMLVIQKAASDSTVLNRANFDDGYYTVRETNAEKALAYEDTFTDTLMYLQVEEDYEPIRMLTTMFNQNGKYYELRVVTSMVEEDDLIKELLYSLFWLYAGLLATILLLNNFILKRIWRPFYELLKRLRRFKLDDPTPLALPPTKVDEFGLLNDTIGKLLNSNANVYNLQKQFIENASHELQTPLAISLTKLEALAETAQLTDEQAALLASALNNLDRMTRLNKALLLLTRIENRQYPKVENINFRECAEEVLADFSEQIAHQQIQVSVTESAPCVRSINPDLATVLFLNLIKNALVHNHPGGFIHLLISRNSFTIENSGEPEPLQGNVLFNRFYKGNPSNSSTGIGLAIVKAIADLYGFRLQYEYQGTHLLTVHFG